MADIFVNKSNVSVNSFTDQLSGGMPVKEFIGIIESTDLSDPESVMRASNSCRDKCHDIDVDVDLRLSSSDGCSGTPTPGNPVTEIKLRGVRIKK